VAGKQDFSLLFYFHIFLTAIDDYFHITIRKIHFPELDNTLVLGIIIWEVEIAAF